MAIACAFMELLFFYRLTCNLADIFIVTEFVINKKIAFSNVEYRFVIKILSNYTYL